MIVAITGASGFIGRRLLEALRAAGHSVRTLGRSQSSDYYWDALRSAAPAAAFDSADAVVHLAGEPIAQRWNAEVKRRIVESRVSGTRNLVAGIAQAANRPAVLLSASAIGYYGDTGEKAVDESGPPARGFLPGVTRGWEEEAERAAGLGLRVVRPRIGIVLGREGGALAQMLTPFKLGVGGPLGSGRQWMSWIHVDDLVALILFAIANPQVSGAVNATVAQSGSQCGVHPGARRSSAPAGHPAGSGVFVAAALRRGRAAPGGKLAGTAGGGLAGGLQLSLFGDRAGTSGPAWLSRRRSAILTRP